MSSEDKENIQPVKMKRCNKGNACLTGDPLQPITNFSKRKASPDGHTYTCKTCEAAAARDNYHRRKKTKKYKRKEQEDREKRLQYYRDYYQENKEKKAEYDKEYQTSKRGRKVMKKAQIKRRAAMKEGAEVYLRSDVIKRDSVDGVLYCQICHKPIKRLSDLHIDHIIPIVEGGRDELSNVRCTHKTCNLTRPKDGSDLICGADTQIAATKEVSDEEEKPD